MCRYSVLLGFTVYLFASGLPVYAADSRQAQDSRQSDSPAQVRIQKSLGSMPMAFTKNMGQWPDSVLFRASSGNTTMWFTRNGIYYQFLRRIPKQGSAGTGNAAASMLPADQPGKFHQEQDSIQTAMVKAEFVGANPSVDVVGFEESAYKCNYFVGNDPTKWRSDVPNYSGVTLKGLYPGVDVSFRGENGRLEFEQNAASQMALDQVQVEYRGADAVVKGVDGKVVVQTAVGEKAFKGLLPADDGLAVVSGTTAAASAPSAVSLVYSTYLGGSGPEIVSGIKVDAAGCAHVTGWTYSADFPRLNAFDNTLGGSNDVFVTKLTAGGNGLVYSTFLGGGSEEEAWGIALDAAGSAYVTGQTRSVDFPVRKAPYNVLGGDWDGFVTKLAANGSALVYSTYLGGSDVDLAYGIAVDATGAACVTGTTRSTDFPMLNAYDNTLGGTIDGFVTKLGATGSSLVFSTYLGGDGADSSCAIAVNGLGDIYVTGSTNSTNFPVQYSLQTYLAGASDAFVTKLSSGGTSLEYSTYLGGAGDDIGYAIVCGSSDSVYITGRTNSTNFPTYSYSGQPFQSSYQGGAWDAFVAEISQTLSPAPRHTSLVYSTYLGGGLVERTLGIARKSNNIYVTGYTYSDNFPTLASYQTDQIGVDAFVTKLAASGSSLVYSTYIGGNSTDWSQAIAVDDSGNAYVTGYTVSTNFPIQNAYQTDRGDYDAFVTKLSASIACCKGTRGNVNTAGIIDLGDLSLLIAYLTMTPRPTLPCPDAANVNGTGIIDLTDLSLLIAYLTMSPRPSLPNCP